MKEAFEQLLLSPRCDLHVVSTPQIQYKYKERGENANIYFQYLSDGGFQQRSLIQR